MHPERWIELRPEGVYCRPGDFYIDPLRPVARAVITHGHSDHARPGHGAVAATAATLAIMDARFAGAAAPSVQSLAYGETVDVSGVRVTLHPAGHVLGSAQILLERQGGRIVFAGDYKRAADPTCQAFEPIPCDVFVSEATFALPVFTHPPAELEIDRLLASLRLFPERCHLVGAYSLGKCQRLVALLRRRGYGETIYLHGAMVRLCELYEALGVPLGPLAPVTPANAKSLAGQVVIAPPSALHDVWSRKLPDVLAVAASGWMRIRARARQKAVELPLVISDHADWPELMQTVEDVGAPEIWVTHGREEALLHAVRSKGLEARALSLLGYEDEAE